ncbi:maleylacetoacetate isomerase [Noviherbaspirillum cavernae]|uniref:Maleylacetoacetate isomerase n=1 Tax=Noviherbaspirillum cavernae TaxID=2320862 RepID=A0A418X5D7_9BURK|nr:maleylacetoacetate isomerase [Noviherbaspirillum cavernae]RJG07640.1 maleylacetoacetate isomerase [Noviherbaspirillum cavernae]
MKLYTFHRSSASFRVRIALNLKGLPYESLPVHLSRNGGEQNLPAFKSVNPQGLVPVLIDDEGHSMNQSLAILEYLEETCPQAALLPSNPVDRARVRSLALMIACEIHPLNNLRVLHYVTGELGVTEEQKNTWYKHWVELGLTQLEQRLSQEPQTGRFCHGDTPTFADCCLVPQIFNAKRFECDLSNVPTVMRIFDHCMEHEAFIAARPERQIDAS